MTPIEGLIDAFEEIIANGDLFGKAYCIKVATEALASYKGGEDLEQKKENTDVVLQQAKEIERLKALIEKIYKSDLNDVKSWQTFKQNNL